MIDQQTPQTTPEDNGDGQKAIVDSIYDQYFNEDGSPRPEKMEGQESAPQPEQAETQEQPAQAPEAQESAPQPEQAETQDDGRIQELLSDRKSLTDQLRQAQAENAQLLERGVNVEHMTKQQWLASNGELPDGVELDKGAEQYAPKDSETYDQYQSRMSSQFSMPQAPEAKREQADLEAKQEQTREDQAVSDQKVAEETSRVQDFSEQFIEQMGSEENAHEIFQTIKDKGGMLEVAVASAIVSNGLDIQRTQQLMQNEAVIKEFRNISHQPELSQIAQAGMILNRFLSGSDSQQRTPTFVPPVKAEGNVGGAPPAPETGEYKPMYEQFRDQFARDGDIVGGRGS